MNIAFRADASLEIGMGHVMRCLALADELRARGNDVRFICRRHLGHLVEFIKSLGFECYILPEYDGEVVTEHDSERDVNKHEAWLNGSWDADATARIIKSFSADVMVVDHYSLDEKWERVVATEVRNIIVIDDLADRSHECDLLLDQNADRSTSDYGSLVPSHCRVLLGPTYALLRAEFRALRTYSLARREGAQLSRILVSMGGVDKDNVTRVILESLKYCNLTPTCEVLVVMSSLSPGLGDIVAISQTLPFRMKLETDVRNMARLMAESDIAIGAAGTTAWERCCLGLPSIAIVIAENQRGVGISLEKGGAARLIWSPANIASELVRIMEDLVASPKKQAALSEHARALTDGLGVQRVSDAILDQEALHAS